jgi:hypothetical protein
MFPRDQRAHLVPVVEARADFHLRQALPDRTDRDGDVADDDHRDGHAALAGRAVAAETAASAAISTSASGRTIMILAPPSACILAAARARLVDLAGDRGRSHEGDGGDVRMLEDRVDRDLVAVDDVEDAVRQTGL